MTRRILLAVSTVLAAAVSGTTTAGAATVYTGSWACGYAGYSEPIADARVELMRINFIFPEIVRTGFTDRNGDFAITAPDERANYWVRLVLRSRDDVRAQTFWANFDWFADTGAIENDRPERYLGRRTLLRSGPGSPFCALHKGLRDAVSDYRTEVGQAPPFRPVVIGDSVNFGTPYTAYTDVTWPGHVPYSEFTMRHEFGHAVRHRLDGDVGHFAWDVTRFLYPQNHRACDRKGLGFAFNEGWAAYWARQIGPDFSCDGIAREDYEVEGNVAAAIARLARNCGRRRADMVAVLRGNPDRIHSYPEFERAAGGPCAPPPQAQPVAVAPPPPPHVPEGTSMSISQQLNAGGVIADALRRNQRRIEARLPDSYSPLRGIRCLRKPCDRVVAVRLQQAGQDTELDELRFIGRELGFLRSRRELRRLAAGSPAARQRRMDRARTNVARGLRRIRMAGLRDALRVVRPVLRVDRGVGDEVAALERQLARLRRGEAVVPPRALSAWRSQVTFSATAPTVQQSPVPPTDTSPTPPPPPPTDTSPTPPPPPPTETNPTPPPPPPPPPSKQPSSMTLYCPVPGIVDTEVPVSGMINPSHAATVTLTITEPKGGTQTLTVGADASGAFKTGFKPSTTGDWEVSASWAGDADHTGASASCTVTVSEK